MNRRRWQIQYGTWGEALFQTRHAAPPGVMTSLTRMPEWYAALAGLAGLAALGALWAPLRFALVVLALAGGLTVVEAWRTAGLAAFTHQPRGRMLQARMRTVTAALHLLQPIVRFAGRQRSVRPRTRTWGALALPVPRTTSIWSECWASPGQWLVELEHAHQPRPPRRGGPFDRWDLEVRGGWLGAARLRAGLEEHGTGRQLARLRTWPVLSNAAVGGSALLALLAALAAGDGAPAAAVLLGAAALALAGCCLHSCCVALGALRVAVRRQAEQRTQETPLSPPVPALMVRPAEKAAL